MVKTNGLCLRIVAMLSLLAYASFAERNLATVNDGFLLYCSDSAPNYALQAGSAYDGKPETAWVSGQDMEGHWMKCIWRHGIVELCGLEMDFTPIDYSFWTHAQLFRKETAEKVTGKTIRPASLETEILFADGTSSRFRFDVNDDLFRHSFEKPLENVSCVTVRISEKAAFGVREIKILGNKPAGCASFMPQFSTVGGYWIWGDDEPCPPSERLAIWNFRRLFDISVEELDRAVLTIAAYSRATIYLNGEKITETYETVYGHLPKATRVDIGADKFRNGRNLLAVTGVKTDHAIGPQGIIYQLAMRMRDGRTVFVCSDGENHCSQSAPEGWNSDCEACVDWNKAKPFMGGNGYGKTLWGIDYSMPFFQDRIHVTAVKLSPAQPKAGDEFALDISFRTDAPLAENYGVIVEFGELPVAYATCESLTLGEAYLPPAEGLRRDFNGECSLRLSGRWPCGTGSRVPMRLTLCNGKAQAEPIPDFDGAAISMPGKLSCLLGGDDVKLPVNDFPVAKVSCGRVWVDGRMIAPMCHTSSLLTADRFADFAVHGSMQIFRVPAPTACSAMDCSDGNSFCHEYLDALNGAVMTALRINPQSKFLVMLSLDAPNEWLLSHPSAQFERGDGVRQVALTGTRKYTFHRESIASEEYHEKVARTVRAVVTELRRQPYANAIVGIFFSQGRAGENTWGLDVNVTERDGRVVVRDRDTMLIGDMSDACRKAFVKWLRAKYRRDSRWIAAWKLPPKQRMEDLLDRTIWPNERLQSELLWRNRPENRFIFRDGKAEGTLAQDYFEFFNTERAMLFLTAARAVKEASDGRLIVGGYAGYTVPNMTNSPPGLAQHSGHQMCSLLRESDCFDFISSPHIYDMRRMGDPVIPHGTVDSMRLNGKTVINEFDTRTFLSPISPKTFSQSETIGQMRKEFAYALIKGQGYWLLEFPGATVGPYGVPWYSDDALQRELAIGRREYQKYLDETVGKHAKSPNGKSHELEKLGTGAEIALFLSEHIPFHTDVHAPANTVSSNLINVLMPKFSLTGAPYDLYAFEDLQRLVDKGLHRQYKLMVFLNAFNIDPKCRKTISSRLKRDGRTLLFLYAPGILGGDFSSDSSLSLKGIEAVTGIAPLECVARREIIGMDVLPDSIKGVPAIQHDALGWSEDLQREFYGDRIGPVLYLRRQADSKWKAIATLRRDGQSETDKVSVAMLEQNGCRIIHSTIPELPIELLEAIIAEAGVHRYAPHGVIVYANRNYLCVNNGTSARTVPLKIPRKARWFDVFGEKECADGADALSIDMLPGETRLFRLE